MVLVVCFVGLFVSGPHVDRLFGCASTLGFLGYFWFSAQQMVCHLSCVLFERFRGLSIFPSDHGFCSKGDFTVARFLAGARLLNQFVV